MNRWRRRSWLGATLVAAALQANASAVTPAESDEAQRLFDEALDLMNQRRYAEACPKLEQSQALDPGMGTKYRLAECFESAGLTGTAWRLFSEVVADANASGRTDREAQAREHADALAPHVPWLVVTATPDAAAQPGLEIRIDEQSIDVAKLGQKIAIDPGAHTVVVTATGRLAQRKNIRSLEGSTETLAVPVLDPTPPGAKDPQLPPPPPPAKSGFGQRVASIVVGGVGLAGIGVGIGFGLLAKSTWDDALAGCEGGAIDRCSDAAIADGNDARGYALASTLGFVFGGAALVTAPIVWFTAPSGTARAALSPVIGPRTAGLKVLGEF